MHMGSRNGIGILLYHCRATISNKKKILFDSFKRRSVDRYGMKRDNGAKR